jgi:hypothetical protein
MASPIFILGAERNLIRQCYQNANTPRGEQRVLALGLTVEDPHPYTVPLVMFVWPMTTEALIPFLKGGEKTSTRLLPESETIRSPLGSKVMPLGR